MGHRDWMVAGFSWILAGGVFAGGCVADTADDDTTPAGPVDADGDGYDGDLDCDDARDDVFPGSHATEVPFDGIDTDCDGLDACRDLDCDGWPDLVFAQTFDAAGSYLTESAVWFGGADGFSFQRRVLLPTVGAMGVAAADVDGDGYVDLAFANVSDGAVRQVDSFLYHGGANGFDPSRRTDLPTVGSSHVSLGDVDGDGRLDLVFSNRWDGATYDIDSWVYLGTDEGFHEGARLALETHGASHSAVVDLDQDGFPELVFANGSLFTEASAIYWGSAAGFAPERRTELPTYAAEGVTVADFDRDGFLDLVFPQWCLLEGCDVESWVYWGSATGWSEADRTGLPARGGTDAVAADFDGDGDLDVALSGGAFDADRSTVYPGTGDGFDLAARLDLPTTAASGVAAGDLDLDGHVDLVVTSFYPPSDGGAEVSQVFWGGAEGLAADARTDLETQGAAGVVIVGAGVP